MTLAQQAPASIHVAHPPHQLPVTEHKCCNLVSSQCLGNHELLVPQQFLNGICNLQHNGLLPGSGTRWFAAYFYHSSNNEMAGDEHYPVLPRHETEHQVPVPNSGVDTAGMANEMRTEMTGYIYEYCPGTK